MGGSTTTEFFTRNDSIGIPNDKTGTLLTGVMHVFTAVVGAGVLNLPYAVSWLGWIAGPSLITLFYVLSLFSAIMLGMCFEVNGIEHERYHHLTAHILGRKASIWTSVFQLANIFLVMWAYAITGGEAIVAIAQVACEYEGADLTSAQCFYPATGGMWKAILIFGGAQLALSQVRNLEEAWWVSIFGTIGSILYSLIALVLGMAHADNGLGSVGGTTGSSAAEKTFQILNGFGSIAFAYNFAQILPEIQSTLRQPPSAIRTMTKVSSIAITSAYVFYIWVAVAGYASLGALVQPIILQSFCGPNWAIMLAQISILLHMLSAFQVFGQALFNTAESHVKYWLVARQLKAVEAGAQAPRKGPGHPGTIEEADEQDDDDEDDDDEDADGGALPQTPFEMAPSGGEYLAKKKIFGFDHVRLEPIEQRLSTRHTTEIVQRHSSTVSIQPSASLHQRKTTPSLFVQDTYSRTHDVQLGDMKKKRLSMFSADTGFANEEVLLNEEGLFLPLPYRLVVRSTVVLIITALAAIMPFFGAFIGLCGAVTWYPLAIYFPFAAYRAVYPVTKGLSLILTSISVFTCLIALAAAIGAVRNIIVGFSTYSVFGLTNETGLCAAG